jgi:hypothetical protein
VAVTSPVFGGLTIPPASSLNAVAAPRALVAAGARSLIPVTYGPDRVPALILNVLTAAGQPNVMLVQCLWGHGCSAISEPRLNDQALPAGAQILSNYTGAQTVPDNALGFAFAAQGITYTDTLQGYAYSVLSMPVARFDGQLALSTLINGRRVYDPRKDSTAGGAGPQRLNDPTTWDYSDNPSLCLADWVSNAIYGAGEPVDWASVPAAANANDQTIGAPAEKRRVLGVTLTAAASVAQVAEALRAYAGCWLVPGVNGLRLVPDQDGAAVASYSHAAGQIASIDPLGLRDLGNMPTAVEVVYTDTSKIPWRDASVEAKLPGAGVTLPWRLSSVKLPGVQRSSQALREAIERLNKLSLSDLSTTVEVFDGGVAHDVADIITLTHPLGLAAKPMRVTAVEMPGPGRWRLSVSEHDPASYSDLVQTSPTYADTNRVTVVLGDFETVEGAQAKADAAQAAAIAAAAADATTKAGAAQAAAIAAAAVAAQAKADLAETTAKAYADGKVSAEESRAIADATNKANAAQAAAVAAAAADATAKANAAQAAAAIAAQAKADLAEATAKAYADGVVDAEEARAIADATAKASAAQAAAVAAAAADATAKANAAALTADWSGVSNVNVTTAQIAPGAATSVLVDQDAAVVITGQTGVPYGAITVVNEITFTSDHTGDCLITVSGGGYHIAESSPSIWPDKSYATCRGSLVVIPDGGALQRLTSVRYLDVFTGFSERRDFPVYLSRRLQLTQGQTYTVWFDAQKHTTGSSLVLTTEMRIEIIKR